MADAIALQQPSLASGSVFVSSLRTAIVGKAKKPLAFTIMDIVNRLTTGGATIACRVTDRGHGRLVAAWPIAEGSGKKVLVAHLRDHARRNFWLLINLRRELRLLTARFLCLGMPGSGMGILAVLRLPPRRLPAANLPLAFRLLAVTLVPAPRLVLTPAPFAQALRGRGRRALAERRVSLTLAGAHGRNLLPRESSGRMRQHSLRALSKHESDGCLPVYRITRNKTKNETDLESPIRRRRWHRR